MTRLVFITESTDKLFYWLEHYNNKIRQPCVKERGKIKIRMDQC